MKTKEKMALASVFSSGFNKGQRREKPRSHLILAPSLLHCMVWLLLLLFSGNICAASAAPAAKKSRHTSNHALIVSSSRYWFNYRHANNALSIYQLCKSNGIPDENIILMLADDYQGNPRNPFKNNMYVNGVDSIYNASVEIDYRGDDVTVDNVVKALMGKSSSSRVLHTDAQSNIMIYWTGHGGDGFFKFQDYEEITSVNIAKSFERLHDLQKYNEILFVADTCQAFTLADHITAPNVYSIGSSLKDENSYAHHSDRRLGLSVIERYTHTLVDHVRSSNNIQGLTLKKAMVDDMNSKFHILRSHVGYKESSCRRPGSTVPLVDFFGQPSSVTSQTNKIEMLSVERDCTIGTWLGSLSGRNNGSKTAGIEGTCAEKNIEQAHHDRNESDSKRGMEPTDPRFTMAIVAFLGAVLFSSRIW